MLLRRSAIALLAALAGVLSALGTAAGARAAAPAAGTPVLGTSLLSAEQMAAWYGSLGIAPRGRIDVAALARLFAEEGAAQNVRADLAFAQSMLETAYLRFGGQVRAGDNNYSGLGACDPCARGLAFASPELGVRAQIQHLWAYADPAADPARTARPLADARFAFVRPYGRAPLWEHMGRGNWATDREYARKVLAIWGAMLAYHGLERPAARAAAPLLVRVTARGAANAGGWALRRAPLVHAPAALGAPASATPAGGGCLVRWPGVRAAALVAGPADPCAGEARARWLRLAGPAWQTGRGLAPGDALARLRALYPAARRRGGDWWLVTGREGGRTVPRLRAEVRAGRVTALRVDVGA